MNTHMYVLYVNWKYIYVKSEFLSQLSFIHLFISQYYWLPASCQALFQVLQLQGIKRSLHSTGVYIVWWGETDSNRAKIKDLVYQLLRNAMKENNAGIGERVPKDGGGDVCPDKRHYQRKLHWQGDILADTWNILIEKPRGSLGGSAWWVKETASAKALWQETPHCKEWNGCGPGGAVLCKSQQWFFSQRVLKCPHILCLKWC